MKKVVNENIGTVYRGSIKTKRGITLIALVITIIILLILAGIAITQLTENGLLSKTKTAKNITNYKAAKEQVYLKLIEVQLECEEKNKDYTLKEIAKYVEETTGVDVYKYYGELALLKTIDEKEITDYKTLTGIVVKAKDYPTYSFLLGKSGDIEKVSTEEIKDPIDEDDFTEISEFEKSMGIPSSSSEKFTLVNDADSSKSITVGDEVADKDEENYFVVKVEGDIVTLLTKYNLNVAGTAQAVDADYGDTACVFTTGNSSYWADAAKNNEYYELNDVESDNAILINKAKSYATSKGGTGRLLTYSEADTLKDEIPDIIWGRENEQSDSSTHGYLNYWLGTAYTSDNVWIVNGNEGYISNNYGYGQGGIFGVRPVVVIPKSLIKY